MKYEIECGNCHRKLQIKQTNGEKRCLKCNTLIAVVNGIQITLKNRSICERVIRDDTDGIDSY